MIKKILKNKKACPPSRFFGSRRGITLVEILVAIAIIIVLISITLPQFSKMKENQVLKNTVSDVVSVLQMAQSKSLASVNSSEYGVHFQSDKMVIFTGKTYSQNATDNNVINIVSPSSISNVTFAGNSTTSGDIYFARLTGDPNVTGTITVVTPAYSKIITISATGSVSLN